MEAGIGRPSRKTPTVSDNTITQFKILPWTIAIGAILLVSTAAGISLGISGRFDFSCFYDDACHLVGGGDLTESTELEWYVPGMRVAFMPLAMLPHSFSVVLWNGINLLAVFIALYSTYLCTRVQTDSDHTARSGDVLRAMGIAFLLIAPVLFSVFQLNQVSFWPLALILTAYLYALRRRQWTAGVLLGLAIFVKVIPALLLGWCVLRKRFKMAVCAAILPPLLSFGIDAAVNGSTLAWKHHVHWYNVAVHGSAGTGFVERGAELSHKNQGLAVVLTRLLHPTDTIWSQPLPNSERRRVREVHIASLQPTTIKWLYRSLIAASIVGLAAVTWWAGRKLSAIAEHGLLGIWCVAMMWFAPLMRPYYLVWAFPALALLVYLLGRHRRENTSGKACIIAIVAWLLGLIAWAVPEARAVGCNQYVNLVLMLVLAWEIRRARSLQDSPHDEPQSRGR